MDYAAIVAAVSLAIYAVGHTYCMIRSENRADRQSETIYGR